ncbi:MAG: hypothetical protein BroJett040_11530 [Oligoflexia bacterium]|nr:MAG: hypothetical protein BroJett040_11530 [Oligoflexia bacterium]
MVASEKRKEASQVDLSPVLVLKSTYLDDKKPQTYGTYVLSRTQATEYSVGLAKKFSTGTQAQVSASASDVQANALVSGAGVEQKMGIGSLGVSLSQSLWKDGFGASTRLKWDREAAVEKAEKSGYDLQQRQLLIEAESAFWDLIYLQEEMTQRKASLERAKRIESWVKRRVENGIGDRADLLNAQGLVAARELQLLVTQDEHLAMVKRLNDFLEVQAQENPNLEGDLKQVRNIRDLVGVSSQKNPVRLDAYLSALEAQAKMVGSREAEEAMKPDLVLEGQYKTNPIESSMSSAMNKLTDTQNPTTAIAVKLTWLLDGGAKGSVREAARQEALASQYKKERKLLESQSSWEEIQRRHTELGKKIKAAQIVSQVQAQKAAVERDKLTKGRTVTSQVITAEQDAAEAELTLVKLQAEQRKLEAQSRLFVSIEESL